MARSRVAAVQSIDSESDSINLVNDDGNQKTLLQDEPGREESTTTQSDDDNGIELDAALQRFADAAAHNPGFLRRQEKRRTSSLNKNTIDEEEEEEDDDDNDNEMPVPPTYQEVLVDSSSNEYDLSELLPPYTSDTSDSFHNVDIEDISDHPGTSNDLLYVTFNDDVDDDDSTIIGSDSDDTSRSYSSSPPSSTSSPGSDNIHRHRRRLAPLKVPYNEIEESGDMVLETPAMEEQEDTSNDVPFLSTTPINLGPDQKFPIMQPSIEISGGGETGEEKYPKSHIKDLRLEPHEFTYKYTQIDDIKQELEDWYSYSDVQSLIKSKQQFEDSFHQDWSIASDDDIINYMKVQLDNCGTLEALEILYYLVQGVFGQASSTEQQLDTAKHCCNLLFKLDGFSKINTLVQRVASELEDFENNDNLRVGNRRELVQECDCGISILFFMCQLLRNEVEFCTSLYQIKPPILPFLITSLAKQRNMTIPAVPADRLLGLTRIIILCSIGGDEELNNAKKYCQKRDGFSSDEAPAVHCFPSTFDGFVKSIRTKYPFYECPQTNYPSSCGANSSMTKYLVAPKEHLKEEIALLSMTQHENAYAFRTSIGRSVANAVKSGRWGNNNNNYNNSNNQRGGVPNNLPFLFQSGENGEIPTSLQEAGRVYLKRMKVTSSIKQLWDERNEFTKFERGWIATTKVVDNDNKNDKSDSNGLRLWQVEELYKAILPHLESFTVVVCKLMLTSLTSYPNDSMDIMDESMEFPYYNNSGFGLFNSEEADTRRLSEIRLKTALGVVLLLVKWFKRSHILKYEYVLQLLSDANFLSLALRQLGMQDKDKLEQFQSDVSELNYFAECRRLSNMEFDDDNNNNNDDEEQEEENNNGKLLIKKFSRRSLYSDITMMRIVQKICKRKVYRILFLTQTKSTAILKKLLNIEQVDIKYYILKLVKEQVRYLGKKWRQSNMRLLSMIYLHCNLTLGEDWLSNGQDIEGEIELSYAQEVAMRAITQFYNTHHYPIEMEMLGFTILPSTTDFFSRELDAITLSESS